MTYEQHLIQNPNVLDLTGTIHHSTVYGDIVIVSYFNGIKSEISPDLACYLEESGRQIKSSVVIGDNIYDRHIACNMKVKTDDNTWEDEHIISVVYLKRGAVVPQKAWFYRALCAHYYKFEWATNIFSNLSAEMAAKEPPVIPVYKTPCNHECEICEGCDENQPTGNNNSEITEETEE